MGILIGTPLQKGRDFTDHYVIIKKSDDCPNIWKYIDSRLKDPTDFNSEIISYCIDIPDNTLKLYLNQMRTQNTLLGGILVYKQEGSYNCNHC